MEGKLVHVGACSLIEVLRCLASAELSCFVVALGLRGENTIEILNEWASIWCLRVVLDHCVAVT